MRTRLPVRVERLWWLRGLRRLLLVLGTLPRVLDATEALDKLEVQLLACVIAPGGSGASCPAFEDYQADATLLRSDRTLVGANLKRSHRCGCHNRTVLG
jgi:hypothetical protein